MRISSLALLSLLLACGDEVGAVRGEAALRQAGLQAGVYHLPERIDAADLQLNADGSFRWVVFGCDFGGGDLGRWRSGGDSLTLLPREGRGKLRWFGNAALAEVESVTLRASDDGLEVSVGDELQTWRAGGLCAICGGGLGPTGVEACDDPFADVEDSAIDY
jgi:hypothetical protein